jgi:pyocin large subunit-like protein
MRVRSVWCAAAVVVLSFAALAGCDQRLASQPSRDHRSVDGAPAAGLASTGDGAGAASSATDRALAAASSAAAKPVRLIEGRPMWADNRRHTAEENAQYQFERHGTELGARDLDDFLVKAHHFVNDPPPGVLTLTRANGDKLMFDPKSGLFGVARSDGAPRTVTKPEDGRAFWDKQVAENKTGGTGTRRTAARSSGDDRS